MRWNITALAVLALALCEGAAFGAAGDLDPSFGSGGRATFVGVPDAPIATTVQADGKIVLLIDGSIVLGVRRLRVCCHARSLVSFSGFRSH